jgi:hypothetical protein
MEKNGNGVQRELVNPHSQGRPLMVIDGDSFAHRSYHALPKTIRRSDGKGAGAILQLFEAERRRGLAHPEVLPIRAHGRWRPPFLVFDDRRRRYTGAPSMPNSKGCGRDADRPRVPNGSHVVPKRVHRFFGMERANRVGTTLR